MADKNQDVNAWTTLLANPANAKNAIAFKGPAVDGQKAIIKIGLYRGNAFGLRCNTHYAS